LAIYRLAVGRGKVGPFRSERALTRARSLDSPNALLILAAINIATLGVDLAVRGDELRVPDSFTSSLLPLLMLAGLVLLVFSHSLADAIIGGLGIVASLAGVLIERGPVALVLVLLLAAMLVFLLGVLRGFTRS
jgi:hypothetical protein